MQGRVILGRYEVVQLLGHGSMGQVWLARDRMQQRPAVVKVMHAAIARRLRFRELFQREMQLMAAFRHPHAVAFFDADPNLPCLVMEYVPGVGLDRILNHRRLLIPDEVGDLLVPLCQALHAAHTAGIVHRDLKPANVMVAGPDRPTDGVKLMDLGLGALATKPHISIDRLRGAVEDDDCAAGSPAYVCPEQLRGDPSDHRGDIYSLGVVLFELLTGRLPFDDADTLSLLEAHLNRTPPTFRKAGMGILPPAVERLVQQCLEKFPNERPQSAYDLACGFHAALGRKTTLDPSAFQPAAMAMPEAAVAHRPSARDPQAVVEHLEAFMPESIAAVKLRGFVDAVGGTVVASEPGLIRVRLNPPKRRSSVFLFLAGSSALPSSPTIGVALDLHLTRKGSSQGRLEVTAEFRAPTGPLPTDPNWHRHCRDLLTQLRSYLMA
jgi:hypothetical protein